MCVCVCVCMCVCVYVWREGPELWVYDLNDLVKTWCYLEYVF